MKTEIIKVNVNGIYEWGPGFISQDACYNWNRAFDNFKYNHIRHIEDSLGSKFLVGIYFGGMIHPMDGATFYINPNHCGDMKGECRELFRLFCSAVCPTKGSSVSVHHYYLCDDGTIETIDQLISETDYKTGWCEDCAMETEYDSMGNCIQCGRHIKHIIKDGKCVYCGGSADSPLVYDEE